MLTPEQREEGRRLLALISRESQPISEWTKNSREWQHWIDEHIDALLDEPETDAAEIKRAAVREFAERLVEEFETFPVLWRVASARESAIDWIRNFAAARGVKLDEKC